MKLSSRTALAAALAVASLGGIAAGEAPEPVTCTEQEFAPPLTTEGFSELIDAPDALVGGNGSTDLFFTVDLGPDAYADTVGTLAGTLTWTVVANDYDLSVAGSASENFQPFDPAEESASSAVAHCQVVTVSVIDFLAPANVEQLQLDLSLTRTN